MAIPWNTTRERIKQKLPAVGASLNADIDSAIEAATGEVERLTLRRFYPTLATKYVDWPNDSLARSWRIYFEQPDQLVSLTSLTSGGTSLTVGNLNLEPANGGPPYSRLETDRSTSTVWLSGDTSQQSIAITGLWGYRNDEVSAGTIAEALDASETAVDVSNSAAIGVGSLIRVDDERMIVTEKTMLTTGQTLLTTALTAVDSSVTVNVTTGTAFAVDELIMIDSEIMRVLAISGNALTVRRAQDGTVLAAHNTGTTIYAPRTLTVERGALGTTAATHDSGTAISRWKAPALIERLTIAETVNMLLQDSAGWGRMVGAGESARELSARGLKDLREQVIARHGRRLRKGTV
jgi:hypothetical protein